MAELPKVETSKSSAMLFRTIIFFENSLMVFLLVIMSGYADGGGENSENSLSIGPLEV